MISSMDNPLEIVMTSDTNITANFVARAFTDGFESGIDLRHLLWTTMRGTRHGLSNPIMLLTWDNMQPNRARLATTRAVH